MPLPLAPRKLPRQSRSQATVEAILEATARVLVERGYAAASTNAVAEFAGVSVGSLYQYFPNKDALVAALVDRHRRQMLEVVERAMARHAGGTLEAALTGVIDAVMAAHEVDAELHRVFDAQFGDQQMHVDDQLERYMAPQLRRLIEAHRAEVKVRDLRLAVYMLMHAIHSLVHAATRQPPAGVSRKAVGRETVRLALAYLTCG